MLFSGHHEHSIDGKHRLAIPAKFRARLDPDRDGAGFYVAPGHPPTTLWLYTRNHFERLANDATTSLIPDDDQLRFEQTFFAWAEWVEMDDQGRVLMPERMLRKSRLQKDVVICGVRDHLEIWNRAEFEANSDDNWERMREFQLKARGAYGLKGRHPGREAGET